MHTGAGAGRPAGRAKTHGIKEILLRRDRALEIASSDAHPLYFVLTINSSYVLTTKRRINHKAERVFLNICETCSNP